VVKYFLDSSKYPEVSVYVFDIWLVSTSALSKNRDLPFYFFPQQGILSFSSLYVMTFVSLVQPLDLALHHQANPLSTLFVLK